MNKQLNLIVVFVLCVTSSVCQACLPPFVEIIVSDPCCPECDMTITAKAWDGSSWVEIGPNDVSLGGMTLNSSSYESNTLTMTASSGQGGNYSVSANKNMGGQPYSGQDTAVVKATDNNDQEIDVGGGSCEDPSGDNPGIQIPICTCDTSTPTFDSSLFSVTQSGGGSAGTTTFTVSLARPASTLTEREMNAVVKFSTGEVVRLRRASEDLDTISPIGGISRPDGRSCLSCGGGNKNKLNFYGMSAVVATRMEDTLANQSLYLGEIDNNPDVKINVGGKMFRVANRKNWTTDDYNEGGNIGFEVTAPDGTVYQYYKSGISLSAGDELLLQKILRPVGSQTETITLTYDGVTLLSQEDESENRIDYEYTSGRLTKLKCYDNMMQTPGYDREIQFEYRSENNRLWKTYCASCGASPQKYYSYTNSKALYYDSSSSENLPTKQPIIAVWDSQAIAQSSFSYDAKDRMRYTYHYGRMVNRWIYQDEPATGLPYVIKKDYIDGTNCRVTVFFYDESGTGVLQSQREYHDLQTEASSAIDDIGDLAGEDYSETSYETSVVGDVKTATTELPSGTQILELYDLTANGHLMSKYKENGSDVLILGEYDYGDHDGQYLLDSFHLPRYGTSNNHTYYYDSSNHYKLTKEIAPGVTIGAHEGTTQKITHTKYDSLGRLLYQFSSTSSGFVGTAYTYDNYGNRDLVKNGCVFTVDGSDIVTNVDESDAIVTDYDYNSYNQLVQVATINGSDKVNVGQYFYDADGVKIGEAAMLDDNDTYAISAEKFTYDTEGRMIIKSVVMANQEFAKTALEADLAVDLSLAGANSDEVAGYSGLSLTWIHTVYGFDSYGDQVFVVQDAKQYGESSPPVERKHLQTGYTYNYLGEVTETRNPDGTATQIERDGRGLVKKRISGYYNGSTFVEKVTIEYTYDANGNLLTTTEPHPSGNEDQVKTVNVYDVFDRLVGTHKELIDNAPAQ